ncbi:MAG: antibiotic biosynthesis monooxygenase [Solirubrobacterales bacterium]
MESPILIDTWTVDPSRKDELVRRISDAVRDVIRGQPGFVSAQIYESSNGGVVMLSVRMRTAKERQHLTDSPEAQKVLRELRKIAHAHAHLYRLVEEFGEPD